MLRNSLNDLHGCKIVSAYCVCQKYDYDRIVNAHQVHLKYDNNKMISAHGMHQEYNNVKIVSVQWNITMLK